MFEFLVGSSDRSSIWRRPHDLALTLSLDSARLNTAQMGAPIEAASFLGPADDRQMAIQGEYYYYAMGVCVSGEDLDNSGGCLRITCLQIIYQDEKNKFQPYAGIITFRGDKIDLAGMTEEQFLARFGDCYWRDKDKDESILFYEFLKCEWHVEFDEHGILKRLVLTDQPMMADRGTRLAYGVTKPWPPERP